MKNFKVKWIKLEEWLKNGIDYISENCQYESEKVIRVKELESALSKMKMIESEDDI